MKFYSFLADVVVFAHALYIGFVIFALLAILIGFVLRWKWVRNFWFRMIHLAMIAVVVVQALVGVLCPLTTLEQSLRERAGEATYSGAFIGHWVHELIFFDAPPKVFTICYCVFGAAVLATFVLAPPRWPWSKHLSGSGVRKRQLAGSE